MTDLEVMEARPEAAAEPVPVIEADAAWDIPAPEPSPAQILKGQNFSVASMVLGIVGFVLAWPMGLVCGILGIVFSQISKNALGHLDGKARAGLICGIIGLCIFMLVMIFVLGMWFYMFTTVVRDAMVL